MCQKYISKHLNFSAPGPHVRPNSLIPILIHTPPPPNGLEGHMHQFGHNLNVWFRHAWTRDKMIGFAQCVWHYARSTVPVVYCKINKTCHQSK
jgi:hypothetical protein